MSSPVSVSAINKTYDSPSGEWLQVGNVGDLGGSGVGYSYTGSEYNASVEFNFDVENTSGTEIKIDLTIYGESSSSEINVISYFPEAFSNIISVVDGVFTANISLFGQIVNDKISIFLAVPDFSGITRSIVVKNIEYVFGVVNIASTATIDYTPFDITNKMVQVGTVDQSVDGYVGSKEEGFGWAMSLTSSGDSFLETGIDIVYDFGEPKQIDHLQIYESAGTFYGDDSYILTECILSYWDGSAYQQIGNSNATSGTLGYFSRQVGQTTNKIRVRLNLQGVSYGNYNSGYLIWYLLQEVKIFATTESVNIDVHPFQIVARIGVSSPVKMHVGDLVYSLPLVALDDPTASALRIFDGTNIKAFQKA